MPTPDPFPGAGDELAGAILAATGSRVRGATPVHGGDVSLAYRVELESRSFVFAKTHRAPPADFFDTEARGLGWLRQSAPAGLRVPRVLAQTERALVLEWIDVQRRPASSREEARFGRLLGEVHRAGAPAFGRDDGRTTGSRRLPNDPRPSWAEFLADCRLLPLARLARDARALPAESVAALERLAGGLGERLGPAEPPARLHGDLWAGNRLLDESGHHWLIDPACFGGHREFDLAMMALFGGFGSACFDAYAESHPLADGWRERLVLHQLVPLTVHAIKFGGSYVGAVRSALRRMA